MLDQSLSEQQWAEYSEARSNAVLSTLDSESRTLSPSLDTDTSQPRPEVPRPAVAELLNAAERLRSVLGHALDLVAPPPRRPTDLVQVLRLDKSLAGRLNRAAATDEPIEAVLDGAGVQGMRQAMGRISDWAERTGSAAGVSAATELGGAIDSFARACDAFPDGRTGLETVMADYMPEMRAVSERKARRSMFQAHEFLMGVRMEVSYKLWIRFPSPTHPHLTDLILVDYSLGVQVLRSGVSAALAGLAMVRADEPDKLRVMTVDRRPGSDPLDFVIRERTTVPPEGWRGIWHADREMFILPETHPALSEPLDFATAQMTAGAMRRWGTNERPYDTSYVIVRKPARVLVWDELAHESLGVRPERLTSSFASRPAQIPARPELDSLHAIHQPEQFESLGRGTSGLASRDVPDCPGLVESMLRRAGVDPERMLASRLRIEYPIEHARMVAWMRLPEGP